MKIFNHTKVVLRLSRCFNSSFCQLKRKVQISNHSVYPYKFGGLNKTLIMDVPEQVRSQNQQLLYSLFGKQILTNFTDAYRQFLKGLHERDQNFLSQILQKNLIKNIEFPNTKAIDLEAQIEPITGKFNILIHGCYDRNILSKYQIVKYSSTQDGQINVYKVKSNSQARVPKILFSAQIYFKSPMKLVKLQSQSNKESSLSKNERFQIQEHQEQLHMLQFQFQNNYKSSDLFFKSFPIVFRNLFNQQRMFKQYMQLLLGNRKEDLQWRIGDVDQILKGNFTEPVQ